MEEKINLGDVVPGDTVVLYDGFLRITDWEKCYEKILTAQGTEDDVVITLDDCAKIAEEHGMTAPFDVLCEDWTHGEIYRYGEYTDKHWVFHGKTIGFA